VRLIEGVPNFRVGIVTLTSIQRLEITSGAIEPITQPAERLSHFVNPESTEWPMLMGNLCVPAQPARLDEQRQIRRTMRRVCDYETEQVG